MSRPDVLARVARTVLACQAPGAARRVGIDGVDGAGKTWFADELAVALERLGAPVVRASVDGFHHPSALRYRRGRDSPEGFFRDSYDYESMLRLLLRPLSPGGSGQFVRRIYDVQAERPVHSPVERAPEGAVLVVDGIFLHRPELVDCWECSVFLDVPFTISIPRGAQRGYGDPDPHARANRRYVGGQRLYLAECLPRTRASVVIDNADLERPRILTDREGGPAA